MELKESYDEKLIRTIVALKKSICLVFKFNEKFSNFEGPKEDIKSTKKELKTAKLYPEGNILCFCSQFEVRKTECYHCQDMRLNSVSV